MSERQVWEEEDDCNQSDGDMKDGGVGPVAHEGCEAVRAEGGLLFRMVFECLGMFLESFDVFRDCEFYLLYVIWE